MFILKHVYPIIASVMTEAFDRCGVLVESKLHSTPLLEQLNRVRDTLLQWNSDNNGLFQAKPQILFVKARSIRCDQLCIQCATIDTAAQSLLVVPLTGPSPDSFTVYYYLTLQQWLHCKLLGDGRRVLRLSDFLRVSRPTEQSPPPQPHEPMEIAMEVEFTLPSPPCTTNTILRLRDLSAVTEADALFQCGMLMDFILMRLLLPVSPPLEAKWSHYMQRSASVREEASCALMATYVKAKHCCNDETIRQWIAMETRLFSTSAINIAQFHTDLMDHLRSLPGLDVTLLWQHSQWHSCTLNDAQPLFWHCGRDDCYTISAFWLLEEEMSHCATSTPKNGHVALGSGDFVTYFLPCLYRHLLLDLVHCWYYSASPERHVPRETLKALTELHVGKNSVDDVFEFNAGVLQWHTSPVMKRVYRYYSERELAGPPPERKKWTTHRLADHVEMEDLFAQPDQYLPPCLSRLVTPKWYKHEDRLAMVSCLVDSGYKNGARAVEMMCRTTANTATNRKLIGRLFNDLTNKKQGLLEGRRVSRACDTVINSVYQTGNLLRCPYEEAANGETRRRDHSKEESEKFRTQCACSLAPDARWPPRIFSPLDYISHKLARNKASTQ